MWCRKVLASVLVLLSPLGCGDGVEFPVGAGKVVVTFQGERLVLDTGNDGQTMVGYDGKGPWYPACEVRAGAHFVSLRYGGSRNFKGFHGISVDARDGDDPEEGAAYLAVRIDADLDLACETTHQTTFQGTTAWSISVAPCDLSSDFSGNRARLEEASFRVERCYE